MDGHNVSQVVAHCRACLQVLALEVAGDLQTIGWTETVLTQLALQNWA